MNGLFGNDGCRKGSFSSTSSTALKIAIGAGLVVAAIVHLLRGNKEQLNSDLFDKTAARKNERNHDAAAPTTSETTTVEQLLELRQQRRASANKSNNAGATALLQLIGSVPVGTGGEGIVNVNSDAAEEANRFVVFGDQGAYLLTFNNDCSSSEYQLLSHALTSVAASRSFTAAGDTSTMVYLGQQTSVVAINLNDTAQQQQRRRPLFIAHGACSSTVTSLACSGSQNGSSALFCGTASGQLHRLNAATLELELTSCTGLISSISRLLWCESGTTQQRLFVFTSDEMLVMSAQLELLQRHRPFSSLSSSSSSTSITICSSAAISVDGTRLAVCGFIQSSGSSIIKVLDTANLREVADFSSNPECSNFLWGKLFDVGFLHREADDTDKNVLVTSSDMPVTAVAAPSTVILRVWNVESVSHASAVKIQGRHFALSSKRGRLAAIRNNSAVAEVFQL